jgi:hypothetical protein
MLINNVYLVLSSGLLIAYPIWIYFFLKKNYYNMQFKTFKDKYDKVYDGI